MAEAPAQNAIEQPWRLPDLTRLPPLHTPLLDRLRPGVARMMGAVWQVQVHHADRLPQGPAIFAVNHVGVFDGPLAVALVPGSQALAKGELWSSAPLARVLDALGQIPVDREYFDTAAIRRCLQVLEAGRRLVIFPESHRGKGNFEHFKHGAAYLALVTGAPVVPVALLGTAVGGIGVRSIPKPRSLVHVVYGDPVAVEPMAWPRTARQVDDLSERLRTICAQHVQQAQQETGLELPLRTPA